MATADLLLTNAFVQYAAHLQRGRVRAQEIHEEWRAKSPRINLAGLLQTGLDLGKSVRCWMVCGRHSRDMRSHARLCQLIATSLRKGARA